MSKSVYDEWVEFNENVQKQEKLLNKIKDIINRPYNSYIISMLEQTERYVEISKLIKELKENE